MHTRSTRATAAFLATATALALTTPARADTVSFRHDVMAVLSRAGCNQGVCHGNLNGKGGFKLSLRGEDPDADYVALTRDLLGRRTNPLDPADSLILQKATAAVSHEGGRRFASDSTEYRLLFRWIAAGLPADPANLPRVTRLDVTPAEQVLVEPEDRVQVRVTATFADGRTRDVTDLACYELSNQVAHVSPGGEVRRQTAGETAVLARYLDRQAVVRLAFVPARPGFTWIDVPEANYIDRLVFAKLRALRMRPSELTTDSVFLRRVYLDTLGVLPTAEEARAFLSDARNDKRGQLIDQLLTRPEFADFWALKWSDLLRNEEKTLDRKGVLALHQWVRQSIADGKPLDQFARELLAGQGSTYANPPANYYRALRDPQVRAEATAQVFLGLRLQCCKCHSHPFDRWTQDDYHGLAAAFARVRYRIVDNQRRDQLDSHEFDGEQIVWQDRAGELPHPRTGQPLAPRFLTGAAPDPNADRLGAVAAWVTHPDNPFFARTQANRVWAHLLGRGIVDPVDDFRASNPPSNEPLLDELTRDFVAHRYDLRHLVRTILNSRTYQLSSVPNETNHEDEANFSRSLVRPLPAEPLADALVQVTGGTARYNGSPEGTRAGQLPGVRPFRLRDRRPSAGENFLKVFGKPERLLNCECERSNDATLAQAFQLISGSFAHELLTQPDNRLGRLLAAKAPVEQMIEELYLAALCRPPSDKERQAATALLEKSEDRRAALEDLVWGLVNAKAFLLRQ